MKFQTDKNGYSKSIMQSEKECYISKSNTDLVRHEIFYGNANRKLSKVYGLWVWLTPFWHNSSNVAVHFNKKLDNELKKAGQKEFERTHTREEFIKIFGRSWL